ncbi:histidine kinase [Streptomyces sp. NPDC012510]|uniref:sensor histidine kinase n=1 Tax=Streptomyces sp. NPDC012510 TaxID=3364838 RepID=UPI0036E896D3
MDDGEATRSRKTRTTAVRPKVVKARTIGAKAEGAVAMGAVAVGTEARSAELVRRWWSGASSLLHARGPLPRPSRWMWTADVCLAFLLAACTVGAALTQDAHAIARFPAEVWTPVPEGAPVPPPPPLPTPPYPGQGLGGVRTWQLLLAALTALPLLVRRRYPLTAFWAVVATTMLFNQHLGTGETTVYTFLSCLVAAYSAAVHSPYRLGALASLVAGAALIAAFAEENFPYVTPGVIPFLVLLGVGLGANAIHTWKQRVRALQEQQAAATRLAVEHERSRIARELHDVVTHNVSVMVIQAGAARKVMDAAPDRAREALLAVEAGGRTAMTELRHVMGLLTMPDLSAEQDLSAGAVLSAGHVLSAERDLAPQPGLDRLPALIEGVREAGVPVRLTVTGTPAPLSPGADLAAYRVVQEALTNAVKHASGARVEVTVDHTPHAVHVEITDTGGSPTPAAASGTGRGLLGLRERLSVYGGTLQTGSRPTGGYRVRAVVPLGDNPPEHGLPGNRHAWESPSQDCRLPGDPSENRQAQDEPSRDRHPQDGPSRDRLREKRLPEGSPTGDGPFADSRPEAGLPASRPPAEPS